MSPLVMGGPWTGGFIGGAEVSLATSANLSVSPLTEPTWDIIPDPLPAGSQHEMLQYLNDPLSLVTTTRAIGLSGSASYNEGTGILTYAASSIAGVEMEAGFPLPSDDWATRSTASGVMYADNFDYADTAALKAAAAQFSEGGGAGSIILDTDNVLSGKGLRITTFTSAGSGTGNWAQFMNGVDDTPIRRFYIQFIVYNDEHYLNYPFKQTNGNNTSPKFIILDRYNASFAHGEVVVNNGANRGFVSYYGGGAATGDPIQRTISGSSTPCPLGDPDFLLQGMIDRGTPEPADTCPKFKQRRGPLKFNFSGTVDAGILLDEQGTPDPDAAIGGYTWKKNGWTVIEVFVDAIDQQCQVWAADLGDTPLLLADTQVFDASKYSNYGKHSSQYNGFQLTTFRTNGKSNEANRQETFTTYGEVITSLNPIKFPGGFVLPGVS